MDYLYNAWKPGVKDQIEVEILNCSGIRDISRNLKINKNTVISELKKKTPLEVNPYFLDKEECQKYKELEVDIRFSVEGDEFWSYVGKKSNQRWTWYVIERQSGIILAYQNGRRTDQSCKTLIEKLSIFSISRFHTDDWKSYSKYIPRDKHTIGKDNTWKIERKNLNFRTHIKRLTRKTICFSKSEKIHDNIIGMYINKFYFKQGLYSQVV